MTGIASPKRGVIDSDKRAVPFDRRDCPQYVRRGDRVKFNLEKGRAIGVRVL